MRYWNNMLTTKEERYGWGQECHSINQGEGQALYQVQKGLRRGRMESPNGRQLRVRIRYRQDPDKIPLVFTRRKHIYWSLGERKALEASTNSKLPVAGKSGHVGQTLADGRIDRKHKFIGIVYCIQVGGVFIEPWGLYFVLGSDSELL
jgi:hypothetical protein